LFLSNFNMAAEHGIATAICKKKKVKVVNDKGITVTFKSIDGETVLNAIQLRKLDSDNAYQ
jgi:hypothetical protein